MRRPGTSIARMGGRTKRFRSVAAIGLAIAALSTAACSGPPAAPVEFTDRAPLPSCGEIVLDQGETIPEDALDCMEAAVEADGGELKVTSPTVEGDPIVTYYRVGPGIDGVDMFIDGTADAYGAGTWIHENCPGDATISEFGGCTG